MSVKILNEELKRIHEIMGIKHNLIVESGGLGGAIAKYSDEFIQSLISKIEFFKSNAGRQSSVTIGGRQFSQRDVTTAINILKSGMDIPTQYDNASQNVKNVIKATMSQDTELSNLAYLELIRHLKNTANLTEEEVLKNIQDRMQQYAKSGRGDLTIPFDAFKRQFPSSGWEDLLEVGENAFNRQYSDFSETGRSFRPIQSQYRQNKGEGRMLTDIEKAEAANALREVRFKKFNRDFFNALRKSANQVKVEISDLSKGYWDDLAENPEMSKEQVDELSRKYAVQIVRRLNILEAKENNAAVTALRSSGVNIPDALTHIIYNDSSEFFKLYRSVWGKVQFDSWRQEITEITRGFFRDVRESFMVNETKGMEKWYTSLIRRFINVFNPKTKFGQFMLTDSFAAFDRQWQLMIKQSGLQKGNRGLYILTAAYLNSVGYVIGSTIKEILSIVNDVTLLRALNAVLPLSIGIEGEDPWYTFEKFDNEETMKIFADGKRNAILVIIDLIFNSAQEIYDTFIEEGPWSGIKKITWSVFVRSLPMGLGTFGDSISSRLAEWVLHFDIPDLSNIASAFVALTSSGEAEVVAYTENEDSFKEWYKSTYPDKVDEVRSYKMEDKDPNDIYFRANMRGTNIPDEFYKYDSDNSNFKPY